MAVKTDFLLTLDLMLTAVPCSSLSIFVISVMAFFAGMIKEIILVPFLKIGGEMGGQSSFLYPLASSSLLIKRLIFHCSIRIELSSASMINKYAL